MLPEVLYVLEAYEVVGLLLDELDDVLESLLLWHNKLRILEAHTSLSEDFPVNVVTVDSPLWFMRSNGFELDPPADPLGLFSS